MIFIILLVLYIECASDSQVRSLLSIFVELNSIVNSLFGRFLKNLK